MYPSLTSLLMVLPLIAMLALILQQTHLLMSLLSIEGIMLTLVLFVPLALSSTNMFSPYTSILLLSFGACEASLGLSLMVLMSRTHGSDMMNSLTINKC